MLSCKYCNKIFQKPSNYNNHLLTLSHKNKTTHFLKENNNLQLNKTKKKTYICKYCNHIYKHSNNLCRHIKSCKDKAALEHILNGQNIDMDAFLKLRKQKHDEKLGIIPNNINNGKIINNIQINNNNNIQNIIKINAFGNESYDQILNDKDISVKILKKLNYGVNSLFFTIYNEEQNRNFYKAYSGRRTIATLSNDLTIKHTRYNYIIDTIFCKMNNVYYEMFEKYKDELNEKESKIVERIIDNYDTHGLTSTCNKDSFNNYLDYMSKDNKELIHNYLVVKGIIKENDKLLLGM